MSTSNIDNIDIISKMRAAGENKVIHIRNRKDYDDFKNDHKRGVIFYGSKWCQACEEIEPLYIRIANRYHRRIALAHVDVDEAKLDFTAIPVFTALHNGKQIDSMEGADKEELKKLIKNAIKIQ